MAQMHRLGCSRGSREKHRIRPGTSRQTIASTRGGDAGPYTTRKGRMGLAWPFYNFRAPVSQHRSGLVHVSLGTWSPGSMGDEMSDSLVDSEEGLKALIHDCRPQEQYTFLMEALCNEMPSDVKTKAISLLKAAILGIKAEKRYMYLSSCLPTLLKRCTACDHGLDQFVERLEALKELALIFPQATKELDTEDEEEKARKKMQGKVMQSMVSAFLLKLLQKAFPLLMPVTALDLDLQARSEQSGKLKLLHAPGFRESHVACLCNLAQAAARSSPRPMLALLEEIDLGDPQGDGGGDLEISPLSLAIFVLLAEQVPQQMFPYVLPLCISKLRRVNILMRSCYVLLCNAEVTPNVVNLGDLAGGLEDPQVLPAAASPSPCYAQRALLVFAASAALFSGAKLATLKRKVLDSLTSTDDVEHKARGVLFQKCSLAMRAFDWMPRSSLIYKSRKFCHKVIVSFGHYLTSLGPQHLHLEDDWWSEVTKTQKESELLELRLQLANCFFGNL
eukprot:s406_g21.t1